MTLDTTNFKEIVAVERATLKSQDFLKVKVYPKTRVINQTFNGFIQIIDIQDLGNGISVFAKAWNAAGEQIGFGKDGSVDVERFNIYNPPVLVSDPLGDITRPIFDEEGLVKIGTYKLRLDPLAALISTLSHTISVKKQAYGPENIQQGKWGSTTSTFYPDANPETNTVDGFVRRDASVSWGDTRTGDGTGALTLSTASTVMKGEVVGSNWGIARSVFLFDTSSIGSDSVDLATLSLFSAFANTAETVNPANLNLVESNPITNTNLVNSDYPIARWGSTLLAPELLLSTWANTEQYHDLVLNASGLAVLDPDGITKLGVRASNDIENTEPTARSFGSCYYADTTGTDKDPKLVVEHSAGGPPPWETSRSADYRVF